MKDKDKLAPMLRAFKSGDIDFDYAIDYILHIFSASRRFNYNSFMAGVYIGAVVAIIVSYILF